jgi:hypothetical protein
MIVVAIGIAITTTAIRPAHSRTTTAAGPRSRHVPRKRAVHSKLVSKCNSSSRTAGCGDPARRDNIAYRCNPSDVVARWRSKPTRMASRTHSAPAKLRGLRFFHNREQQRGQCERRTKIKKISASSGKPLPERHRPRTSAATTAAVKDAVPTCQQTRSIAQERHQTGKSIELRRKSYHKRSLC